jgi:hypothetical protein
MRRWYLASIALTVLVAGLTLVLAPALLRARAPQASDDPPSRAVQLPIGQVVLFSSGVGYFQREGSVENDARVDLSFPVSDINDLIKSMVLRDLDGGHISTVSYDSNAPIERTLKSFAINLTGTPTFANILHQARGEKAEVALANAGAGTLSGTIIGVETQRQTVNKEIVETPVLNLWCSDGMRSVKLSEVQRVRFLNANLDSEFKKALETLALSHDTQKKAVSIRFVGEGKRRVKVGYVIENPIWKTSYRLVLSPKGEEKPYLQGWAVVENPSDEDWKDVRMALVSGRPISFQMDLYQPLYVTRPVVVPELFQGLRPVAYDGRMEGDEKRAAALNGLSPPAPMAPGAMGGAGFGGFGGRGKAKADRAQDGLAAGEGRGGKYSERVDRELRERMQLGTSVQSAASAAKLGDFFQYAIDRPVSLQRQKSALLPIVGKDVQATRVSIYNERVQAKFPLLGLRFKNSSGLHLMQGPITVFEGSNYAGDAQIKDIQPNEERLLSYAIDLGTEVNPVPSSDSGRILSIKAVKGIIHTTTKNRQIKTYTAKNRNDQERTLLVEHPVNNAFTLVGEKPKETTAEIYRFEMKVPAGQSKSLVVTEEREDFHNYAISSSGDGQIKFFLSQTVASQKMKEGLKQALELRWTMEKTRREIAEQRKQLDVIVKDQERLRANLREMPTTAKAYKRYLEKFDSQETEIEKYQAQIKKLEGLLHTQQKAFDDYLAGFTVE